METNSKPKRKRRTKAEMKAARLYAKETGKAVAKIANSSQKSNLEEIEPILDVKDKHIVEGWVNVYKYDAQSYWVGTDIHKTLEDAVSIGHRGKYYLKTIQISFEVD